MYDPGEDIAGVQVAIWIDHFRLCHSLTSGGIIFHAWPDGQPAMEQEAVMIEVFKTMRDELIRMTESK